MVGDLFVGRKRMELQKLGARSGRGGESCLLGKKVDGVAVGWGFDGGQRE